MNRGPAAGTRASNAPDFVTKAAAAWGSPLPDWLQALAEEANRTGAKAAAERIGYSPAVVSQVLSASYRGDVDRVAAAIHGALLGARVDCPALGQPIGRDVCLAHQRRPLSTASPQSVRLFHACRGGCPHAAKETP